MEKVVSEDVVPSIQGQIDAIRAIGEPAQGAEELDAFLDDAQQALDELENDPSALTEPQADPFGDVNKQAKALGLTECAG